MKTIGLVIARMGSSRLPGKSLADVAGKPLIARIIERMRASNLFDDVVLASPDTAADKPLLEAGEAAGATAFAGANEDVLDRFYQAARASEADIIVHIGGDCPFADHELMRKALEILGEEQVEFVSNIDQLTYPSGLDTDAITFPALERMWREGTLRCNRIHCLSYIHQNPSRFAIRSFRSERPLGHLRWTVDYPEDLEFVRAVYGALGDRYFGMNDILELIAANPQIARINAHLSDYRPSQPAYWDSEGYMSDLRSDIRAVLEEAVRADTERDYTRAVEKYALVRTLLDDLAAHANLFAK